jgi:hypothetical protein
LIVERWVGCQILAKHGPQSYESIGATDQLKTFSTANLITDSLHRTIASNAQVFAVPTPQGDCAIRVLNFSKYLPHLYGVGVGREHTPGISCDEIIVGGLKGNGPAIIVM